jgi:hypothetical protein
MNTFCAEEAPFFAEPYRPTLMFMGRRDNGPAMTNLAEIRDV